MRTHVIGLTGFASAGKDTVADLLAMHFGFRKFAFADALRGEVASAYGLDLRYFIDPRLKNEALSALALDNAPFGFVGAVAFAAGKESRAKDGEVSRDWLAEPRSPRQIMQWWGTEYRRRQSPRYWTSVLVERINYAKRDGCTRFVITDCRFENEVDTLRAMGGLLWQIKRPGIDATTTAEGMHASTTDGSAFRPHTVISNKHDLRHLQGIVISEFVGLEAGIDPASVKVTVAT